MGMFSWITMDTGRSIRNRHAEGYKPRTVYMRDQKGNVWTEHEYDGYGVFGGKDFYQLLAEMNEVEGLTGDVNNDRQIGIDLAFSKEAHISPTLNAHYHSDWVNEHNQTCPDQGYFCQDKYEEDDETW